MEFCKMSISLCKLKLFGNGNPVECESSTHNIDKKWMLGRVWLEVIGRTNTLAMSSSY